MNGKYRVLSILIISMHVQQLLVIQKELLSVITHTNCIFLARTDFIIHFVAVNKTRGKFGIY